MDIIDNLLATLPDGKVKEVQVGAFWTAVVGHFPFIPRLREHVGKLWVLEQQPRGEDSPAKAVRDVIPKADVVALTGTTLVNHTFGELMALRRPEALVLVLGSSTPLAPV